MDARPIEVVMSALLALCFFALIAILLIWYAEGDFTWL